MYRDIGFLRTWDFSVVSKKFHYDRDIIFILSILQISEAVISKVAENVDRKKVICYYTNWAWRRPSVGKFLPENIDGDLCTHIIYAFATLDARGLTVDIDDSTDVYKNFLNKVAELRRRSDVKVLLGLGGWNDSKDDKYSKLSNNSLARRRFADHAAQFVESHGFDGLDLDWEFPVCWQVNRKHSHFSFKRLK